MKKAFKRESLWVLVGRRSLGVGLWSLAGKFHRMFFAKDQRPAFIAKDLSYSIYTYLYFIKARVMITKLTLTIEDKVVHSAKKYAHRKGKSLSHLVENYLKSISAKESGAPIVSAKVSSLKGVLQLPDDFNYKTELGKSISAKYNQ